MATTPTPREWRTTITAKGQATIPVEVRRILGVRPHEKIAFVLEGNLVRIVKPGSVVEETAGAFRSDEPPLSARELREAAEQAWADDVIERSGT
jgi:antitoxin PrlF